MVILLFLQGVFFVFEGLGSEFMVDICSTEPT